jgi:hypothetical protein
MVSCLQTLIFLAATNQPTLAPLKADSAEKAALKMKMMLDSQA